MTGSAAAGGVRTRQPLSNKKAAIACCCVCTSVDNVSVKEAEEVTEALLAVADSIVLKRETMRDTIACHVAGDGDAAVEDAEPVPEEDDMRITDLKECISVANDGIRDDAEDTETGSEFVK